MIRKAQIGTTITWIPAFLIVFFVMVLFVTVSAALAGNIGEREVSFSEPLEETNLEFENELTNLLNFQFESDGETKSINRLIIEWAVAADEDKSKVPEIERRSVIEATKSFLEKNDLKPRRIRISSSDLEIVVTNEVPTEKKHTKRVLFVQGIKIGLTYNG